VQLSRGKGLLVGYGALLCLTLVIIAAARACTLHTAAYSVTEKFVRSDEAVSARFGHLNQVSLRRSKFENCRDGGSCVEFILFVVGTRANGFIDVDARKNEGVWEVTSANVTLPGGASESLK
jgi:hypothetical protein